MSAEAVRPAFRLHAQVDRRRRTRIYRLAFGMTLSAGLAFGFAWPISFVTPVLTAKLLTGGEILTFRKGLGVLVVLSGSLFVGTRLMMPMLGYPAVYLLLTGLVLFLLFYAKASGASPILVVLLILAVTVVPMVGTISPSLAVAVTRGLLISASIAIALVLLSTALFPDPAAPGPKVESQETAAPGEKPRASSPRDGPTALALRSVVVLFPLVVVFQLFSLVEYSVVLIMASLLALEPTFGKHLAAGRGLIVANLTAGLVAVLLYQLLVMVPSFPFFLLLMLLTGLWYGRWIFSDHVLGRLLSAGIAPLFVILGPTLTSDVEAGEQITVRIVLIMFAVTYVALAFGLLDRLTRGRRLAT